MPRSKVEFSQVVREAGPPYRVKYKVVLREGAMAGMVASGSGGSHAIEFETSLSAGATQGRAAFIARADGICSVTDGKLLAMPKSWPALTPIEQGESIGAEVTAPGDVKAKPTPPNLAATVRAEMDAFKKRRPPLNQGASEKGF